MTGTVQPVANHNAEADAEILRKAMKGMGTDEKAIIDVVGARTSAQLHAVELAFKTAYGKDLMEDLKSETSGNFRDAILYRFKSPVEFDAFCIREAIAGAGTDERCLIEILTTRTNEQIREIRAVYKLKFGKDLEKDVMDDTSGLFKRLLVSLVNANRDETNRVDQAAAAADAQKLYNAGEGKIGTDESEFNHILCSRNHLQLLAIFEEYKKISKHDIAHAIDSEMSGFLREGMLAIVKAVTNRYEFFAEKLYHSMKGAGTDDRTLVRIVVSRCDFDLAEIKDVFAKKYNTTLAKMIEGDTSGDYKKILIKLVGN